MAFSISRMSCWLFGGKEKEPPRSNSHETDMVKLSSKTRNWKCKEKRRAEKQCGDVVIQAGGIYSSGSESDGPDWSIGWVEPHGRSFVGEDGEDDDGFAVLVPCYGSECKELLKGSNNQILRAIKNLPRTFSSEGSDYYTEWLSSLHSS